MNSITLQHESTELALVEELGRLDQNPAAVFLGNKPKSKRVYQTDLGLITDILYPGMFVCPERPKKPARGASDQEKADFKLVLEQYKRDRGNYNNRCLWVSWGSLRFQHTNAIRARLIQMSSERTGDPLAAATVSRILCALRGVLKIAWRLGQMSGEDYYRARDVEAVTGETVLSGREVTMAEIEALGRVCAKAIDKEINAGIRDKAIIAAMYTVGGMRRAEVVNLDLEDYDPDTHQVLIHGKRSKQRIDYLKNGAEAAMADWIEIRGTKPGPLFYPINKGGNLVKRRLTSQAIYNMLAKRGKEAGVKAFSPHDIRRTFITHLLEAGADVITVSKKAGHESVNTTRRYDKRGERAKEAAAELIHFPYFPQEQARMV